MGMQSELAEYLAGAETLRQAIAGMTDAQLSARPIPGKWSTREVICHIADFEPVYANRMKRVIAEENPPFPGGDPDLYAARLAYAERDLDVEIELIDVVRRHMASILGSLPDEAFQRAGIHSEYGALTLEELLKRITGHIPHHIHFIREKRRALGLDPE